MNFVRNIPKKVLISLGVLLFCAVALFGVFPLLGAASEDADTMGIRLKSEIDATRRQTTQALDDQKYVQDHLEEFESLMKSDRLVPHTRRAAVAELQKIATRNAVTLDYTFQAAAAANSAAAAQNQPGSAAYRVSIEQIGLKVGAATDGAIYRFLEDLADSFPGAAVTQSVHLARPDEVTAGLLAELSQGKAQVVTGDVAVLWRTAEAQEKKDEAKK